MVCLGIGTLLSRIRLQSSAVLLGVRDLSGPKSHSGSARLAPEVSRLRQSFSCCSASANELNFSPHERHGNSFSSMSLRSGTRGSFFIVISAAGICATDMPRWRIDSCAGARMEWLLRLSYSGIIPEESHRTRSHFAVELLVPSLISKNPSVFLR